MRKKKNKPKIREGTLVRVRERSMYLPVADTVPRGSEKLLMDVRPDEFIMVLEPPRPIKYLDRSTWGLVVLIRGETAVIPARFLTLVQDVVPETDT